MARALPPGVTEANFQAALAGFARAVGKDWVFTADEDRLSYTDPFSIGDPMEQEPSAAVAPASVEELQAVLKVANQHKIPLWPVSMGKNFGYGGAAPHVRGTAILDLKRMNRILEINEEAGYAIVEPGVNFFDFHKALDGKSVWMSGPAHSWGSVIGNALEHGVGYTPYGEHVSQICGMEVVLANGDIVRTGMGAVDGSKEWGTYKNGYGPIWDGVFTQSNFAVVTKMGIWLMPEPEGMANIRISVPRDDQLQVLIDTLRPLRMTDVINATFTIVNGMRSTSRVGTRDKLYTGKGATPHEVIAAQLAKQGDGWWTASSNMFDDPEILDIKIRKIKEAFAKVPGAQVNVTQRWAKGEPTKGWMRQDVSLGALGTVDWWGGKGGHADFGPVMAPIGSRVDQVYRIVHDRMFEHGVDPYVGMFGLGRRGIVMVADFIFDRSNPDMMARVRACIRGLNAEMAGIGVGVYRSHLSFMDEAAKGQTFNNHAMARLNTTMKRALDPNGILAPGKQGIYLTGLKP